MKKGSLGLLTFGVLAFVACGEDGGGGSPASGGAGGDDSGQAGDNEPTAGSQMQPAGGNEGDGGEPAGGQGGDAPVATAGAGGDSTGPCPLADHVATTCSAPADCEGEAECFRGVCLHPCAANFDALEMNLGDAVQPVATMCNPRTVLYMSRTRSDGGCERADVFGFRVTGSPTPAQVNWYLRSYEVDPVQRTTPITELGMGEFTSPAGSSSFFQTFPKLNPSGTTVGVLLYYGANANMNPVTLATVAPAPEVGVSLTNATGGFDWLDDTLMIAGQAVLNDPRFVAFDPVTNDAPVPVLTGLPSQPRAVSVLPEAGLVLAADSNNNLYVVELDRVLEIADGTVATPIDVATDPDVTTHTGLPVAGFKMLGETHLLLGAGSFGDPLDAYALTINGTNITFGPALRVLENEQAFDGVVPLPGGLLYIPSTERGLIARWAE
jgi:hypothetical protein